MLRIFKSTVIESIQINFDVCHPIQNHFALARTNLDMEKKPEVLGHFFCPFPFDALIRG